MSTPRTIILNRLQRTWEVAQPNVPFSSFLDATEKIPSYRRVMSLINRERAAALVAKADLDAYEGCVLIDMNPGAGILSGELQRRVKPRRHILLEPNEKLHPILQKTIVERRLSPNTTTLITNLNGYSWNIIKQLQEGNLLNCKFKRHDEGLNTDVLFSANMTMSSTGDRFANQLIDSLYHRNWIQSLGRVKLLCNVYEVTRNRLAPPFFFFRSRSSVMAETAAETRILGSTPSENRNSRIDYNSVIASRAAKKVAKGRTRKMVAGVDHTIYDSVVSKEARREKDVAVDLLQSLMQFEKVIPTPEEGGRSEKSALGTTEYPEVGRVLGLSYDSAWNTEEPIPQLDKTFDIAPVTNEGYSLLEMTPKELDPWFTSENNSETFHRLELFKWMLQLLFTRRTMSLGSQVEKLAPSASRCFAYLDENEVLWPEAATYAQKTEAYVNLAKALLRWPNFDPNMVYQEISEISSEERETLYRWTTMEDEINASE